MRLLKKYIRKLYHLIWFLGAFLLFSPNVNAVVQINGQEFTQTAFNAFADNSNGQLSRIWSTWVDYGQYYRSNSAIYTNGGNYGGANWAFYSDVPFVEGHTYVLSVLIGMANTYAKANQTSYDRLCIAENNTNVIARYNNYDFPCNKPFAVTSTNGVSAFSDGTVTYNYTLMSYAFVAEFTGNAVTGSYNSGASNESNHTFGGYKVEEISSTPLTQAQVQQAVQNSGLATASSVAQAQQSINQIKQEIQGMQQQQQQTNEKLDDIDDTLNDSSIDSSDSTINNLKNQIPTNSVISDLLLLPIRFLQNFVNALNSSCSTFSLGSLLGTNLFMPCINLENYLGSTIWTMIDLIFSGMFVYGLRKKFIQIYENLTNLKNGGNEVD